MVEGVPLVRVTDSYSHNDTVAWARGRGPDAAPDDCASIEEDEDMRSEHLAASDID